MPLLKSLRSRRRRVALGAVAIGLAPAAFGKDRRVEQFFRGRAGGKLQPQIGGGDLLGAVRRHQFLDKRDLVVARRNRQSRIVQDALAVVTLDVGGAWRGDGARFKFRQLQHPRRRAAPMKRHDQRANALAASAARAAAPMQQRVGVGRQVGVNDKVEIRQVDAARRHVGRHADAGASVAHRLKRIGALGLAEFARERDHRKAAVPQSARQMLHRFARVAENDGVLGIEKQQGVDDGVFAIGAARPRSADTRCRCAGCFRRQR